MVVELKEGGIKMTQYRFELSIPCEGRMNITVKDKGEVIKFRVTWACDPIYMLLKAFKFYLEGDFPYIVWPALYFEGEGIYTYVVFHSDGTMVNTLYQSHEFLFGIEEIMTEVMEQLTDGYMRKYYLEWYEYDNDAQENIDIVEEMKKLRKEVKDMMDSKRLGE